MVGAVVVGEGLGAGAKCSASAAYLLVGGNNVAAWLWLVVTWRVAGCVVVSEGLGAGVGSSKACGVEGQRGNQGLVGSTQRHWHTND